LQINNVPKNALYYLMNDKIEYPLSGSVLRDKRYEGAEKFSITENR
jgi:hypothetical protein